MPALLMRIDYQLTFSVPGVRGQAPRPRAERMPPRLRT